MAAFNDALSELEAEGVSVVGASTDPREKAELTATKIGARFPIGYGLELHETARTLTAFFEERRGILHATGFVTKPDTTIGVACYSTAQIGRLVVPDVLSAVRFWKR